jgi:hypothetical protein
MTVMGCSLPIPYRGLPWGQPFQNTCLKRDCGAATGAKQAAYEGSHQCDNSGVGGVNRDLVGEEDAYLGRWYPKHRSGAIRAE